jgi:hypothetical protein
MGATMENLTQIHTGLEEAGYVAKQEDDAIIIRLDGGIPAVMTVEDETLLITCQIATLGELREENALEFAYAALDANSRITPFAISLITDRDDPSIKDTSEYVVTLVDSVPLGDFEQSELVSAMQSLLTALVGCREVIEVGCREPEPATA